MKYSIYNKNYKINHSNKNDFIILDILLDNALLIHKKDLDILLDNAYKKVMKSKLKLVKK